MKNSLDVQKLTYIELIARLALTALISGVIGYERESSGRPAGLRTNMLVGVGSCLIMIVSIQMFLLFDAADPARIAAQVVSGIGFLGAGTIINIKDEVKGLTTAATLWVNAGIGLAIGAGLYVEGIATGLIVLIILVVLGKIIPEKHK